MKRLATLALTKIWGQSPNAPGQAQ